MADLTKEQWVDAATELLMPYLGDEAKPYAESLHHTYVVDADDPACTPSEAVDEDMSYWED